MTQYCIHGRFVGWCPFDVTTRNVAEAFYAIAAKHMPLRYGRDRLYASPEAVMQMTPDHAAATTTDPRLHGLQMRLERSA